MSTRQEGASKRTVPPFSTTLATQAGQEVDLLVGRQGEPEQLVGALRTEVDDARLVGFHGAFDHASARLAARHLEDEGRGAVERLSDHRGVDAPLEAIRRVGGEAQATGGLAHQAAMEDGRLEEDVGRALGHHGVPAAHDAAKATAFSRPR
jgi:hypothetical protein